MPTPFIHLHAHSHYSFLRGLASPQALAQAAAEVGMSALALADHHGLTGAIEFHDACREANVRPIVGLELAVLPPPEIAAGPGEVRPFVAGAGSIVLLAADLAGWRSLCRLSTLAQTAPHRDPERGPAL